MSTAVFWLIALAAVGAAAAVVFARDVMRLAVSLGAFLLTVAGFFLYFRAEFLAVAQVFVYVGGVLVLLLFAIMMVARDSGGAPSLSGRPNLPSAAVSIGMFIVLVLSFGPDSPPLRAVGWQGGTHDLGAALLGRYLPHFEALGAILLATLVGVLTISGKGERE